MAYRILRGFLRDDIAEEVSGDLEEKFNADVRSGPLLKAKLSYWYQVIHYMRPFALKGVKLMNLNHHAMFRSYLKIGIRNLLKNKGYSFINIGGLAAGMAVAMLIGLWVYDELSFDRYFQHYPRIAQVMQNQTFNGQVETWWSQSRQIGPALRENYGGDFKYVVMSSWNRTQKLTYEENSLSKRGNYMEPAATEMLSLVMKAGTRNGLEDPYSILLSASSARAIFGDADPMNRMIRIDDKLDVKVTGVYEDLPPNTTFSNLDFIAPWQLYVTSEDLERKTGWGNSWFQCIAQIADHADMEKVSLKIKDAKLNGSRATGDDDDRFKPEIFLHPMSRWHLYSEFKNGVSVGGGIQYVWMFGIVGVFVLLLACINFMNLSTARSEKRSKEVGIRKTIGSMRAQLISQFFMESMVVVALAFLISLLLVQVSIPWFNEVSGKQIDVPWTNLYFWLSGVGFAFCTGLIAGSFPAFISPPLNRFAL